MYFFPPVYDLSSHVSWTSRNQAYTVNPTATTSGKHGSPNLKVLSQLFFHSTFWSSDFSSNSHALVGLYRGWDTQAPHLLLLSPAVNISRHHNHWFAACFTKRLSGNLSESSLRYSRRPSSASMQITSAHWQLFCCYLLWYSTSSSFRDLREAWPESIYIPGYWKCHIGTDCSQPSFAFEY